MLDRILLPLASIVELLQKTDFELPATAASEVSSIWAPAGIGHDCYGVWHEKFQSRSAIPEDLRQKLNTIKPALMTHIDQNHCPYGYKLWGDITWPSPPEDLRDVVAPMNFLSFIAVVYAYVPYVIAFRVIVEIFFALTIGYREDEGERRRKRYLGTRQLYIGVWLLLMFIFFQYICKPFFKQPRPGKMLQLTNYEGYFVGSCHNSCGMPSSHAALALGWFTLLFLDTVYRVHPFKITGHAISTIAHVELGANECKKAAALLKQLWDMGIKPWSFKDYLTQFEFAVYMVFWSVLMLPVPFMRVVLYDHTMHQALVGILFGVVFSGLWWRLVCYFQRKHKAYEGKYIFESRCFSLKHDLKQPCFGVTKELIPALSHDLHVLEGTWESCDAEDALFQQKKFTHGNLLKMLGKACRGDTTLRSSFIPMVDASQSVVSATPSRRRGISGRNWFGQSLSTGSLIGDTPQYESDINVEGVSLEWMIHASSTKWGNCIGILRNERAGMDDAEDPTEVCWMQWTPPYAPITTWRKKPFASSDINEIPPPATQVSGGELLSTGASTTSSGTNRQTRLMEIPETDHLVIDPEPVAADSFDSKEQQVNMSDRRKGSKKKRGAPQAGISPDGKVLSFETDTQAGTEVGRLDVEQVPSASKPSSSDQV